MVMATAVPGDAGGKKRRVVSKPREHVSHACEPCRKSKVHFPPLISTSLPPLYLSSPRPLVFAVRLRIIGGLRRCFRRGERNGPGGIEGEGFLQARGVENPCINADIFECCRSSVTSPVHASAAARMGAATRAWTGAPTIPPVRRGPTTRMGRATIAGARSCPARASPAAPPS